MNVEYWINVNGTLVADSEAVVAAHDRSYRYGDGLFETMRFSGESIRLANLHFERLFRGLQALHFNSPAEWTANYFQSQIRELCAANRFHEARIRLSISRGSGNFNDPVQSFVPRFIIEATPLSPAPHPAETGLVCVLYTAMRKMTGPYAGHKTANALPYVMARIAAERLGAAEAIVLNEYNRVCEATTANLFWIKDNLLHTIPLAEGPVAGVMRQVIIQQAPAWGYAVQEASLSVQELLSADEVFLTNAISGIRSVNQVEQVFYKNAITAELQEKLRQSLS